MFAICSGKTIVQNDADVYCIHDDYLHSRAILIGIKGECDYSVGTE